MTGLVWSLYGAVGRAAAPLARRYLARRVLRGKEDPARLDEKRGVASLPAFGEAPLWIHAVSIGESVAALTLAQRLAARGWPILLTTSTPAAAARLAPALTDRIVQQYAPLDAPPFVARFLAHWRPAAAIFIESEIWPTTLRALARRGIPLAHVNARLSDRSFAGWQRWSGLARPLFEAIDLALAQSPEQARRFGALGARRATSTGNIKFDAAPPEADPEAAADLAAVIGDRPVWLAASTHPGEDEVVLAAHRSLAARWPNVLTIIAPRHIDRGTGVAELASAAGPVTRRSAGAGPTGAIYIADTMGELATLFDVVGTVLLGASLRPYGGHNPAEPAAFGAALLTGPTHGVMFEPFLAAGAARLVDDATLADAVGELLADPAERARRGELSRTVLEAERGAVDRTMDALAAWLPGRLAARSPAARAAPAVRGDTGGTGDNADVDGGAT
ncbi:3-deoxy-D-manno-octulosonic acid transferase [Acuticoccus sp. I52.16.1]|uniref:3-deoxy-D-manno-octulosonic acid transferase n=1 Tax=Acuticoccus sp. I52.16.1 TaxID=2928472 RepID=UPI001FD59E69|nr:3-deoxy-D-manno-octulosonic acid transferase [Acuticoccus sp. I52.16.1]UOM36253.1 3-deoxy-D-manno-octulosonic acid transferase [Acuticoccus sp. I52.16.1]